MMESSDARPASEVDSNEEGVVDENHEISYDTILAWKKARMTEWLSLRNMHKSGKKADLAKRIFRVLSEHGSDTNSDSGSDIEVAFCPLPPPESLLTGWEPVTDTSIRPLESKDIENYFIHHKSPTVDKQQNFQRQLGKAKKLANEGHVSSTNLHVISQDSTSLYIKGECFPSMRQRVQVPGAVVHKYTQYITLTKSTSFITTAKCNCKAGVAGLCAHVGAVLIVLSRISQPACTSNPCVWTKPSMKGESGPKMWNDISFVNTEHRSHDSQTSVKPYPGLYQAGPCADPDSFLADLLQGLGSVNPDCVLYKTLCSKIEDINK